MLFIIARISKLKKEERERERLLLESKIKNKQNNLKANNKPIPDTYLEELILSFTMADFTYADTWNDLFASISGYSWAYLGIGLALGTSIAGAAW